MTNQAWAEGDALTPTNLNARGTGASTTSTYYVGWASGTSYTQINRAIVNAATGGFSYCALSRSVLPFDASQVSFINTVKMIREGQGSWEELDVKAYGAAGNQVQDDFPAIQSAFSAAAATATKVVALPPGVYNTSKPLRITTTGMRLLGSRQGYNQGANPSQLRATFAAGPTIWIGGASATVPNLVTQLATGTGQAWQMVGNNYWFNLRDSYTLELNGLAAFTVRCYFKSTDAGTGIICSSSGKLLKGDTRTTCFSLLLNSGKPAFTLTTSVTGATTITAPSAVIAGSTHVLEGSYDGSTMRLFVDGTAVATAAVSGTLSQGAFEDVIVGPSASGAPEQGIPFNNAALGVLDSLEVASAARHTTDYTAPTAKFVKDSSTLALMNFDTEYGPFERVDTNNSAGGGVFWAWCRHAAAEACNSGEINGVVFLPAAANSASGIFTAHSCQNWNFHRVSFYHQRNGLVMLLGDNFFWRATDIEYQQFGTSGRYGLAFCANSGLATLTNVQMIGGMLPLLAYSPAITISGGWMLAGTNTVFLSCLLDNATTGAPYVVNNFQHSVEVGVGTGFRGCTAIGTGTIADAGVGALFNGCGLELGNNAPAITADNPDILEFNGCSFIVAGTPTSIMTSLTAPSRPVIFNKCVQRPATSWLPWSNATGDAAVARIGALSSTSTGGTLNFDATKADEWDLTLTSDVTQSRWTHISYGQPVSGAIKMDSTGSRLFTWPTNSKGTVTLSYGSAAVNTFTGFYDGTNVILTSVRTGL